MNASPRFSVAACLMAASLLSPTAGAQVLGPTTVTRSNSANLAAEPGTINIEGIVPNPVNVKVVQESPIYYHSDFQRVLGSMPPGTVVRLIGISDHGYRVRGRARHADVSGWMRHADVISPDPDLHANLKKVYERQLQVQELIAQNQVALGMSREEVEASMGRPTRTGSKVTALGREDTLEYAVFERVPQVVPGQDGFGRIIQTVVYVKVEVGTLSIQLKDNVVETIEEKQGNPLGSGGVRTVVPPIMIR